MQVRANLCHYSHVTFVSASANDFMVPSNLVGGMTVHDATFTTALSGSIFASGGVGMKGTVPRTCVIHGVHRYGKVSLTTSPNEMTIVDALAGTTELTRLPLVTNPISAAEMSIGSMVLPTGMGWAVKVTTTDATGIYVVRWSFLD